MATRPDHSKSHLERVREWLKENVVTPATPHQVTVSDIRFDWKRLRGSFVVALDNLVFQKRFSVWMEITGKPTFSPPMFHSPLGAPASYAAIDLDEKTNKAILKALEQVFPRVRAFGWHKDLDLIIDGFSPFEERIIDPPEFERMRAALAKPDLVSTVEVDTN